MPAWVHEIGDGIRDTLLAIFVHPFVVMGESLYDKSPTLFYAVSTLSLLVTWPFMFMWAAWLLLGVALAKFSVVMYIAVILSTHLPNVIKV